MNALKNHTHIGLVGKDSDRNGHSNGNPEADPGGLGRPAEVLVAVGVEVCIGVNGDGDGDVPARSGGGGGRTGVSDQRRVFVEN